MSDTPTPRLDAADLRRLAAASPRTPCATCASLVAPGWEAMPGGFDRQLLRQVGSLRDPAIEDPTLDEHHPAGTRGWSADAPIAPLYFPYNRCDVWQCVACSRPFVRYTEYGGYYVEERVRELDAELVVDG